MRYTVLYNRNDLKIVGFASFETTMANLGDYDEAQIELQYVDDPQFNLTLGSKVILDADGKITAIEQTTQAPSRKLAAELDDLKARVDDHEARLTKDIGGHIR